jgi:hypothetical protein
MLATVRAGAPRSTVNCGSSLAAGRWAGGASFGTGSVVPLAGSAALAWGRGLATGAGAGVGAGSFDSSAFARLVGSVFASAFGSVALGGSGALGGWGALAV